MEKPDDFFKVIEGQASCPGSVEIPTPEEQAVLSDMRRVKDRVRKIRAMLKEEEARGTGERAPGHEVYEKELAELKGRWEELDARRKALARERMVRLGHENPDGSLP